MLALLCGGNTQPCAHVRNGIKNTALIGGPRPTCSFFRCTAFDTHTSYT